MNEEVKALFETLCDDPIFPDPVDYGPLEPSEDSLTAFGGDFEDESFDEWLHSMEDSI